MAARSVDRVFHKLTELDNRDLLYSLYGYLWELRHELGTWRSICCGSRTASPVAASPSPTGSPTPSAAGWRPRSRGCFPSTNAVGSIMPPTPMPEDRGFNIRPYRDGDFAAVYEVCLKTGDAGQDATHLHRDPEALGHLYVGPYVTLEPELAFVLEDAKGVCGYVLGAFDTAAFRERFVREWLPPLQRRYPDPKGNADGWSRDERLYHVMHHPPRELPEALAPYPAHLHIDLLPRAQGRGQGTRMMHTLLDALRRCGSSGVHLGLAATNERAFRFYRKLGFEVIEADSLPAGTVYMGMKL